MEGLLRDIEGTVETTEPANLKAAYERSLAKETYLSTHPDEIIAVSTPAQSDDRSGDDSRRK
ncbi:hypothetical protein Scep_005212 [Stephania cephalantha]|uniref:Uncharacterized protein n=1 Tax=Stephania cephalantha TaxID=152367 RepID=A0AAP0KTV5_9MAGN